MGPPNEKKNGNGMALQYSLIWCTYWQDVCAFHSIPTIINHCCKNENLSDSIMVEVRLGLGTKLIWLGLVKHHGLDKRKTVIFWKSFMTRSINLLYLLFTRLYPAMWKLDTSSYSRHKSLTFIKLSPLSKLLEFNKQNNTKSMRNPLCGSIWCTCS